MVITNAEDLSEIAKLQAKYSVVKPSCGRASCPKAILQRPKAEKQQKKARAAKRKRVKQEIKDDVEKHRKLNNGTKFNLGKTTQKSLMNYFAKK